MNLMWYNDDVLWRLSMIVRSKAPLRLGFAGGGTDLLTYSEEYGGAVLNVTINMYAHCTIEQTDNGKVLFEAVDLQEKFECDVRPYYEIDNNMMLFKGVYNRIVRDFLHNQGISIKATTYSDAPSGSGLGTSSTMVVAIVKAFVELLNLPLGEYEVARLAYEIERIDLKLAGGKQDQYAATFGGFNFIEFLPGDRVVVNPLKIKDWFKKELQESIVIYFTGLSRSSAKIINEQIESTSKKKENLEAMHDVKRVAYAMKEAILTSNIDKLAQLFIEGWEAKKKTSSSISNSNIETIYNVAMAFGAKAGKISGAGGGGFMMFICEPTKKTALINKLRSYGGHASSVEFTEDGTISWYL